MLLQPSAANHKNNGNDYKGGRSDGSAKRIHCELGAGKEGERRTLKTRDFGRSEGAPSTKALETTFGGLLVFPCERKQRMQLHE